MRLLKFLVLVIFATAVCVPAFAEAERTETEILKNTYYDIHISIYESMPRTEGGIVFFGDSLTDYVPFNELLPGLPVINRGIAGDNTLGALKRVDEIISLKPSKLFILLGTNDIVYNMSAERTTENLTKIIRSVQEKSPSTKIYIETMMPTNPNFETHRPNEVINSRNEKIKAAAKETGCTLIDIHTHMAEDGILPMRYTVDGIHLSGEGVVRWVESLVPYVME